MEIHHSKHHAAYVANTNDLLKDFPDFLEMEIDDVIKNLSKLPEDLRGKVRNNAGGHSNHSFFWKVLASPKTSGSPKDELLKKLNSDFGNLDAFKEKFTQVALGRFGSGWAWLVKDNSGKLIVYDTSNQDSPLEKGDIALLALDVWEHAYYLKYQNRRADYIAAWWKVVNWKQVENNLEKSNLLK